MVDYVADIIKEQFHKNQKACLRVEKQLKTMRDNQRRLKLAMEQLGYFAENQEEDQDDKMRTN